MYIFSYFRAARHGLNMDGKLARLRKQDEQFLAISNKIDNRTKNTK